MNRIFWIMISITLISVQPILSEQRSHPQMEDDLLIRVTSHNTTTRSLPSRSFYQRRTEWQSIIDSCWGPGLPHSDKLQIFDTYADIIHDDFGCFWEFDLDWDLTRSYYSSLLQDTVSRGRFSAIMSHLAFELREGHTRAWDQTVAYTPLSPGLPLLAVSGVLTIGHFGAVCTPLADSTILVLRVVDNHPLNLEPGDIILGYEGVPWRELIFELMDAELPLLGISGGTETSNLHSLLVAAGMNWHLFDTIDILKYASNDTVQLSLQPLIAMDLGLMVNNEQLDIPGVPMPDYFNGETVSYGIIDGTNIGYIYIWAEVPENNLTDMQFNQALSALMDTDGLILDLRFNLGGWALFPEGFDKLFNSTFNTIDDAFRCNTTDFTLCPGGNADLYSIQANPTTFYEQPIAVLIGPNCASMGDVTAYRLEYHPNTRFFGQSTNASPNFNAAIDDFTGWELWYAYGNMYHTSQPGNYLARAEFDIEENVWFAPEDVANGFDTVVESAVQWMNTVAHAHDIIVNDMYYTPGLDTVAITARIDNPDDHLFSTTTYISSDTSLVDSITLFDDGQHGDSSESDGVWGGYWPLPSAENNYSISVITEDSTLNCVHTLPDITKFTTVGPIEFYSVDSVFQTEVTNGDYLKTHYVSLINNGITATANLVTAKFTTDDTCVAAITNDPISFGNIAPGGVVTTGYDRLEIRVKACCGPFVEIPIQMSIFSNGTLFWRDSLSISVKLEIDDEIVGIPQSYFLHQNYPNPFNPTTTIQYELPQRSDVHITIFDLKGRTVTTLVSETQDAGYKSIQWDASNVANGMYFYQIKAGEFVQTKKMILLR